MLLRASRASRGRYPSGEGEGRREVGLKIEEGKNSGSTFLLLPYPSLLLPSRKESITSIVRLLREFYGKNKYPPCICSFSFLPVGCQRWWGTGQRHPQRMPSTPSDCRGFEAYLDYEQGVMISWFSKHYSIVVLAAFSTTRPLLRLGLFMLR